MSIPELTEEGYLPPGEHQCTLNEVEDRFGNIPDSERRHKLCEELRGFIDSILPLNIGSKLIVNGSFVTKKNYPGDIDVFLVFKDSVDEPTAFDRLRGSINNMRGRFFPISFPDIHFFGGKDGELRHINITNTYRRLRENIDKEKGFLEIIL